MLGAVDVMEYLAHVKKVNTRRCSNVSESALMIGLNHACHDWNIGLADGPRPHPVHIRV